MVELIIATCNCSPPIVALIFISYLFFFSPEKQDITREIRMVDDGEPMNLKSDLSYKKGKQLLLGEWYNKENGYEMVVYMDDDYLCIDGEQFADYCAYEIEIKDDEFDLEPGDYILTVKCNASDMSCIYEFSYNDSEDVIYYNDLKYVKTKDEEGDDLISRITDIETAQKFFPDLEGVETCDFEYFRLGPTNEVSRVPGPSTYMARGFVVIDDEKAAEYLNQYEWNDSTPDMETTLISTIDYEGYEWLYSNEFNNAVKEQYLYGKCYLSGNIIWFDFSDD